MTLPAVVETASVEETLAVAERLGRTLRAGDVVWLQGDLGAGKTHFAKGLARGLGLDEHAVRSPTFTFIDLHRATAPGGLGLVHVDLYRIGDASELAELGLAELPGPDAVAAIEWPERLAPGLMAPAVRVRLEDLGSSRRIVIERP